MRQWLIILLCLLSGLTGCQSLRIKHEEKSARKAQESGISNVIQTVPEPKLTWKEETGQTGNKYQIGKRYGKASHYANPELPNRSDVDPGQYATVIPSGTETGFDKLQSADVPKQLPAVALKPNSGPFRQFSESDIRSLAGQRSPAAHRLELENIVRVSYSVKRHTTDTNAYVVDRFLKEARELAAEGDRIKMTSDAVALFYQLAEYEGQAELLRRGLDSFDKMRVELEKPQVIGGRQVKIPPERIDELYRERADILKNAELLEFACKNANIDLKTLTGLVGNTTDRIYPTGDFAIDPSPIDVNALVQDALENRPDLKLLRLAYFELNEDTLPAIREQLKQQVGLMAPPRIGERIMARQGAWVRSVLDHFGHHSKQDPILLQELAVRKAQLYDLICEKEREAADQVRKATIAMEHAGNIVSSTRWKSENLRKQVEQYKASKNTASEATTTMQWYKARIEVIAAVMAWHQAKAKLTAATGHH